MTKNKNKEEEKVEEVQIIPETEKQKKPKTNRTECKKVIKKQKLVLNVFNCKYDIVRDVAKNHFKMRIQEDEREDFDVIWCDYTIQPERLQKLRVFQRVNHFPGIFAIARKNNLGKNLMRMKKKFEKEYDFFPQTWMLPSDMTEFKNHC